MRLDAVLDSLGPSSSSRSHLPGYLTRSVDSTGEPAARLPLPPVVEPSAPGFPPGRDRNNGGNSGLSRCSSAPSMPVADLLETRLLRIRMYQSVPKSVELRMCSRSGARYPRRAGVSFGARGEITMHGLGIPRRVLDGEIVGDRHPEPRMILSVGANEQTVCVCGDCRCCYPADAAAPICFDCRIGEHHRLDLP